MKKLLLLTCFSAIAFVNLHGQSYPAGFAQVVVASGVSNATVMAFAPDGRIFVAEQTGKLHVIKNGALLPAPFLQLAVASQGERGLIGIAFDPDFATNQYLYLYYTTSTPTLHNRISRFTAEGDVVKGGSEQIILELDDLSTATNHNGGSLLFKDGLLYVAVGENANGAHAQNLDTYHGKILRINKDGSVPAGNPFTTGSEQRKRVWAYGLRNPYTITLQPGTGKIYVNDVGQGSWEEINDATQGGLNFGWPTAEGMSTNPDFTNPVFAYGHGDSNEQGCAITGGAFFNPAATDYPASYTGKYFYQEYCNRWIRVLDISTTPATSAPFGTGVAGSALSVTTGPDGNLYFVSRTAASVYKITYSAAPAITQQPQSLEVTVGQSATFSVAASGSGTLTYQWKKNDADINGATGSTYTIDPAALSDAGSYQVVVSNTLGNATSDEATLTVNENVLAIENPFSDGAISIHPNPVREALVNIHVRASRHQQLNVHIYNTQAQAVNLLRVPIVAGDNVIPVSTEYLPAGLYSFRLEAEGKYTTKKVLVVK
jgi:glucose/arabinose dehydrogenase